MEKQQKGLSIFVSKKGEIEGFLIVIPLHTEKKEKRTTEQDDRDSSVTHKITHNKTLFHLQLTTHCFI